MLVSLELYSLGSVAHCSRRLGDEAQGRSLQADLSAFLLAFHIRAALLSLGLLQSCALRLASFVPLAGCSAVLQSVDGFDNSL